MTLEFILLLVVMIVGFVCLYLLMQRKATSNTDKQELEAMINQVFGLSAQKIAEQSREVLRGEKETIKVDLDNKQKTIEKLVQQLQEDMKSRQQEIRSLEQDRIQKFSELNKALDTQRQQTEKLTVTAQQLSNVLSSNQTRGSWGERIIEDILVSQGLIEGTHYLRQAKQGEGRPDILLLLPDNRNVPVDVKFPYAAIKNMAEAEGAEKATYVRQFTSDIKTKITKVSAYINPAENTLDYAILFVPNEMIFSFINQKFPDLVDEAMKKRVMIASPFTFLAIALMVRESYRNFMMSDKLREVVKAIDEFGVEWSRFKDEFGKYGKHLDMLKGDYENLTGTRVRQMDRRIEKVDKLQQGALAEATPPLLSET